MPTSEAPQTAAEKVAAIARSIEDARTHAEEIREKLSSLQGVYVNAVTADPDAVEQLEDERDGLRKELERLDRQIEALEGSLPAARRAIEIEELDELRNEYLKLLAQVNKAVADWREAAEVLPSLSTAAKDLREKGWALRELGDHIRYVETVLDAGHRAELATAEHISEKETDAARGLVEEGLQLTKHHGLSFRQTGWATKLEQLRDERARARLRQSDRESYERSRV